MSKGFTTIELLVVAALAGVVGAVAVSKFDQAKLESGRAEGYIGIAMIKSLQSGVYVRDKKYAPNLADLGFDLADGGAINDHQYRGAQYTFSISQPNGPNSYLCTASGNLDDDPFPDVLMLSMVDEPTRAEPQILYDDVKDVYRPE